MGTFKNLLSIQSLKIPFIGFVIVPVMCIFCFFGYQMDHFVIQGKVLQIFWDLLIKLNNFHFSMLPSIFTLDWTYFGGLFGPLLSYFLAGFSFKNCLGFTYEADSTFIFCASFNYNFCIGHNSRILLGFLGSKWAILGVRVRFINCFRVY